QLQVPPRNRAPTPSSLLRSPGAGGPPRGRAPDRDQAQLSLYKSWPYLWTLASTSIWPECAKDLFLAHARPIRLERRSRSGLCGEVERLGRQEDPLTNAQFRRLTSRSH